MKRIIYCLTILGTILVGCNPLEDINNEIKSQDEGVLGTAEYTLTDDDYDDLELTYGSFNSEDDAKAALPDFLSGKYPYFGNGSSAILGYKLYIGNAFDLRDYKLDQTDYAFSGSDGLGFKSDAIPQDYLADILADNISNASEGDYRSAKYFQYTGDFIIVTPTVSLEENFDYAATAGDLTTITTDWTAHSSAGSGPIGYATTSLSMTDYPSTDVGGSLTFGTGSEDVNRAFTPVTSGKVYASALVNLSAVSTGNYFFHFIGDFIVYDQFRARVGAKDDGSGKILFGIGAETSTLTYGTTPFDLNTTYLLVASYDLATGTANLHILTSATATEPETLEATNTGLPHPLVKAIAVRQSGGIPNGTIDGIRVGNTWSSIMSNDELPDEIIGDKTAGEMYYVYTGTAWETPSDRFYAITEADFASMNIESFGSSTPPDNYLPTFLGLKYPFAQEDDNLDIGYNYVSSSTGPQSRGNLYTVIDGAWTPYQSTIATTMQFGVENGVWIPDNTIRYTVTYDDYVYMGTNLATDPNIDASMSTLTGYQDYDSTWNKEEIIYSLGFLLDHNDPNAAEGQKYLMSYLVYSGGLSEFSVLLIKDGGIWKEKI